MAQDERSELQQLAGDIIDASQVPAKRRGTSIRPTVDKFTSLAYESGIDSETLKELIGLVTRPSFLDQASLNAIIKALYPVTSVSGEIALKVVGCLGHGQLKPSLAIQATLLRWLTMIYQIIEDPSIFSRAYAVLFTLVDTAAIRPQICHLLALVTRRQHVRPFRIQALLNLSRQSGNDPALVGLLRVYKDYYPEIIVGEAVRGKASTFKHPDPQWRTRLDEIQLAHHERSNATSSSAIDSFRANRQGLLGKRGLKDSVVPKLRTLHATENSVTLEEVDTVEKFVNNLEKFELPNQLAAVLADPLLQRLISLRPDEEANQRIGYWLSAAAQDLLGGETDSNLAADILSVLQEYVARIKTIPTAVLKFLATYLQLWNGLDGKEAVLDMLSYAPLLNMNELYTHIFQPMEACVLDNAPDSQIRILRLYTKLLEHWNVLLQSSDTISVEATQSVTTLFGHCNKLCLTILQTQPSVSAHGAILDFYERTSALVSDARLKQHFRIVIPPAQVVYILVFSHSVATVHRLCHVLASYKRGFEMAMATRPSKEAAAGGAPAVDSSTYPREYVNVFNGFLMDICNCLWRSRAFNRTDVNSLGCYVPPGNLPELMSYVASLDTGIALPSLFGLSHSPILCLQSILSVREMEDVDIEKGAISVRHPGPVSQNSLARNAEAGGIRITWQEYRIGVLKSLESVGLDGIPDLMKNTMKILMTSRASGAGSKT